MLKFVLFYGINFLLNVEYAVIKYVLVCLIIHKQEVSIVMAKQLGQLIGRFGLPLIGGIVFLAGAISIFVNISHEETNQPSQVEQPVNATTKQVDYSTAINASTNGNNSPVKLEAPNSNIVGRDDNRTINNLGERQINTTNYTENRNTNKVNGRQINTETYNENCSNAKLDGGSSCVNNGNVTNNY